MPVDAKTEKVAIPASTIDVGGRDGGEGEGEGSRGRTRRWTIVAESRQEHVLHRDGA
jgi:hypothetical protein